MRTERVPLSALPDHFKPIAAAFAADDAKLQSRFPVSWRDEKALIDHARWAASRGFDPELKLEGPAFEKLKKGAPAVVTGQQPSVALGPMYNVYKAITAIRWARKLDAVPVFWNHSDDDNLEGLNRVAAPEGAVEASWGGEGALAFRQATLDLGALEKLGADVSQLKAKVDVAGDFTRLLRSLFGDELLIVEPRQLDGPRAREILSKADPGLVQGAIDRGGDRLKELGFDRPLGHKLGANVYSFDGPRRVPGPSTGRLSGGVAMRLLVQDAVLPTALVISGPNEIAYLAQLRELYEAFGRTGPVVAPRITATLVDPKAARLAEALGATGAHLLAGEAALRRASVRSNLVAEVDALTEDLRRRLEAIEADPSGPVRDATRKTREKL
ncbi:MAG TPA: bacillithiol biosynthesis BshC, partial [Planctomycetota bacterium]|nr:bacillithiol biosynthesis BshC [Planctomycetota bacterium]